MKQHQAKSAQKKAMKTIMKNLLNRKTFAGIAVAILVAVQVSGGASHALASQPAGEQDYTWSFGTGANPAAAGISGGGDPSATAVVTTGFGSIGWLAGNPAFGSASGVWDLGQNGRIACTGTAGFTGETHPAAQLIVRVVQWIDGGIYGAFAHVSVSNATIASTNVSVVTDISPVNGLGYWQMEETHWTVGAGAAINSVIVSSAIPSSVIDSISVVSIPGSPLLPPSLTISAVDSGNQVKISWPPGYESMVLQSSGDLGTSQNWETVVIPPQAEPMGNYVILDATNSVQFFRLKQP